MDDFESLGEMISVVQNNLDIMSNRDISAFWTEVFKRLKRRNAVSLDDAPNAAKQLDDILCHTLEATNTESFSPRDLSQAAIALARIIVKVEDGRGRLRRGSPHQILYDVLIGHNSQNKQFILGELTVAAMPMREEFDPRHLSNLIYALGLAKHVLKFDDGRTSFDVLADVALLKLENFNGQDISNMLWAYGNLKASNPQLFRVVGDNVASRDSLNDFDPQNLANIVWAYATLDETHPALFRKVVDHIVALGSLDPFKPQDFSNILWAYASAGELHSKLCKKLGDHIVMLGNLHAFKPQEISNTVWAYATAKEPLPKLFKKVADHIAALDRLERFDPQALSNILWAYAAAGEPHSELFRKITGHIVALDSLKSFDTQHLSNTVWAYATAKEAHPVLFKKVADAAMEKQSEFDPQGIANLLWAYAANGQIDQRLFKAFAPTAAALLGKDTSQGLANIAWAYAVVDVGAPSLFDEDFINACMAKKGNFTVEALRQLHQWNLWQEELKSGIRLPPLLQQKCYSAFVSTVPSPSGLQDDVISVLSSIGLQPQEEVLTEKGYRLDAVVEANGTKMGVEVDGPSHFVGRKPTGSTILKHRQVAALEGIPLVSVPYWEWNKLRKSGKNREKKEQYLRSLLGMI